MTVAEIVTNQILTRMKEAEEQGKTFYWVKPFAKGQPRGAFSYDTRIPYHGINRLLLDNDEYLTFNKIQELSAREHTELKVRKGAKASIVVYYCESIVKDPATGEPVINEETGEPEVKKGLRFYRVFSRQDVENPQGECLPSRFDFQRSDHQDMNEDMKDALNRFHSLVRRFCEKYGIQLAINRDGTRAFFSPSENRIAVPDISGYQSVYEYCSTILHECCHATMIPLNRQTGKDDTTIQKMLESYSREELVAEIGSMIALNSLSIPDDRDYVDNDIAYLQGWSRYLKNNNSSEILAAAAQAEKASDLILDILREINREPETERSEDDAR